MANFLWTLIQGSFAISLLGIAIHDIMENVEKNG